MTTEVINGEAVDVETGEIHEVDSIINTDFKLRNAGIVRGGIKVLKAGSSANDKKIYDNMVAAGHTWDDIELIFKKEFDEKQKRSKQKNKPRYKNKLKPQNVDYFTIREQDCIEKTDARKIYDEYADDDGKLRKFPIWFLGITSWQEVLPHSFSCFTFQRTKFRSEYSKGVKLCMAAPEIVKDKKIAPGMSVWESRGECDPKECKEFQKGECKFNGYIQFFIPCAEAFGIWKLSTKSYDSLVYTKSALEIVHQKIGKIEGFKEDRSPMFSISKIEVKKSYVDNKDGKMKKTKQWIPIINPNYTMMELALHSSPKALADRSDRAITILEGKVEETTNGVDPGEGVQVTNVVNTTSEPLPPVQTKVEEPEKAVKNLPKETKSETTTLKEKKEEPLAVKGTTPVEKKGDRSKTEPKKEDEKPEVTEAEKKAHEMVDKKLAELFSKFKIEEKHIDYYTLGHDAYGALLADLTLEQKMELGKDVKGQVTDGKGDLDEGRKDKFIDAVIIGYKPRAEQRLQDGSLFGIAKN